MTNDEGPGQTSAIFRPWSFVLRLDVIYCRVNATACNSPDCQWYTTRRYRIRGRCGYDWPDDTRTLRVRRPTGMRLAQTWVAGQGDCSPLYPNRHGATAPFLAAALTWPEGQERNPASWLRRNNVDRSQRIEQVYHKAASVPRESCKHASLAAQRVPKPPKVGSPHARQSLASTQGFFDGAQQ
jgi:hypothetical protein